MTVTRLLPTLPLFLLPLFTMAAELHVMSRQAPVKIDGQLSELDWMAAPVRYLSRPASQSPMHPVTVRGLWDNEALYVGFLCIDTDLRSQQRHRDATITNDGDSIQIRVKANDAEFELLLNPNDAFADRIVNVNGDQQKSRDWTWTGAKWAAHANGTMNDRKTDSGWTCELRLPWSGLQAYGVTGRPDNNIVHISFASVNRNQVANNLSGREQLHWPPRPAREATAPYAAIHFAKAPTAAIEGYGRIINGQSHRDDALSSDYRGLSIGWAFDTADTDSFLEWETQSSPSKLPAHVSFGFVANTSRASGSSATPFFDLLLNGEPILRFDPQQPADYEWRNGEVTLNFKHREGDAHHTSGYYQCWQADLLFQQIRTSWRPRTKRSALPIDRPGTPGCVQVQPAPLRKHTGWHSTEATAGRSLVRLLNCCCNTLSGKQLENFSPSMAS